MPTHEELAEFIADCNRRRYGRDCWQRAIKAAARRAIAINGGGTPQADADMASARRVAEDQP
jgi:hypothetical protein